MTTQERRRIIAALVRTALPHPNFMTPISVATGKRKSYLYEITRSRFSMSFKNGQWGVTVLKIVSGEFPDVKLQIDSSLGALVGSLQDARDHIKTTLN
jgi:hypothetical protein